MADRIDPTPKVSIGVPVYNGENYLEAAIDSLLKQSFRDFEIVIADNASTDRTEEICRSLQSRDGRVRYFRNPTNLGAAANYRKVFHLSRGQYFKWMAHDDLCSPNYLEECVRVLEDDPNVVLCYPKVLLIDGHDNILPRDEEDVFVSPDGKRIRVNLQRNFLSNRPSERYSDVLNRTTECYEFFGLSRRDIIEKTSQHDFYYGSDKVLLCELSVMGKLQENLNAVAYFRLHGEQSQAIKSAKGRAEWISPDLNYGALMSRVRCVQGYCRSIFAYPLSFSERAKCLWALIFWLCDLQNWRLTLEEAFRSKAPKASVSL